MALPNVPIVEPLIPDAQKNKSADIAVESLKTGLSAALGMAKMRRDTESELARLAVMEKNSQQQHDIELAKLENVAEMMPFQQELASAHADYYRTSGANRITSAARDYRFNQQQESLVNDVNSVMDQLRLTDPRFPTDDPAGFAAAALAFKKMYALSPEPWIKHIIAKNMDTASQQKIRLKRAFKDEGGSWNAYGEPQEVPLWQAIEKLQNEDTREEAMEELRLSGHIGTKNVEVEKDSTGLRRFFNKTFPKHFPGWGKEKGFEQVDVVSPTAKKAIEESKRGLNFKAEGVKSRVPPAMLQPSRKGGTDPTRTPFEDEENLYPDQSNAARSSSGYGPTDSDVILNQAIRALKLGAAPNLVAARMQEKGVDPRQLFGEGDGGMMA